MEIVHFPKIQIGSTFVVDGEAFLKRTELIYTDSIGMERYIDPLFDAKIGKAVEAGAKAAALPKPGELPAGVVQSAVDKVSGERESALTDADVDRIARRVAEILKGN